MPLVCQLLTITDQPALSDQQNVQIAKAILSPLMHNPHGCIKSHKYPTSSIPLKNWKSQETGPGALELLRTPAVSMDQ